MSASSSHGPSASVSAVSTPINAGNRPESAPAFGSSQPASTPPNSSSSGGKFLAPEENPWSVSERKGNSFQPPWNALWV
ncbi:hypothetical protein ZHAS_00001564 [Anopheles sinensis]|uniref:Uncharacterized protein n=1 Tax=Anopheles sinensis TaxID=74873 RepID=A0A084VBG0_ANOSI|nr:hypothetical protein ZHAS_00001564 [Anopheles sinensis]